MDIKELTKGYYPYLDSRTGGDVHIYRELAYKAPLCNGIILDTAEGLNVGSEHNHITCAACLREYERRDWFDNQLIPQKRAKELVASIEYALSTNPTIDCVDGRITLSSPKLGYTFNLNNFPIKHQIKLNEAIRLKRMEYLCKQKNLL